MSVLGEYACRGGDRCEYAEGISSFRGNEHAFYGCFQAAALRTAAKQVLAVRQMVAQATNQDPNNPDSDPPGVRHGQRPKRYVSCGFRFHFFIQTKILHICMLAYAVIPALTHT